MMARLTKKFRIVGFKGDTRVVERLRDLGFYAGDSVEIVGRTWLRDPIFVQVHQAIIALRREEFECLQLESF